MCEYWLFLFSIHWNIGCSGWRLLTETCNYRNSLFEMFSLSSDERHQQLAVVHRHSQNQIRKTLNSPHPPPPNFVCQIQFTSTPPGMEKQQKRSKGEMKDWVKREVQKNLSLDQEACCGNVCG